MNVLIKRLNPAAVMPKYATDGSAAVDLTYTGMDFYLQPNQSVLLETGLAMAIPEGMVGLIVPRSGMGAKRGLVIGNLTGVIDSDYRGEVLVCLWNRGDERQEIKRFDRIAQMLFQPVVQVGFEEVFGVLPETVRGAGGFGSTDDRVVAPDMTYGTAK